MNEAERLISLGLPMTTEALLDGIEASPNGTPKVPTADHFSPKAIEWLWPRYLPTGKLVMLDGDPGQGKSLLLCSLMAAVTNGKNFPDGTSSTRKGGAVLLAAEDGLCDTVIPRLLAAGADLSKILVLHAVDYGEPLELPRDIKLLAFYAREIDAALIVADPLEEYLNADIIKGREQRAALKPLLRLLAETGAVLIGSRHLNQQQGQKGMYRGRGDITSIGIARVAYIVGDDPEEDGYHVMARTKGNLSKEPSSLRYRIVEATLEASGDEVALIEWAGTSTADADTVAGSDNARMSSAQAIIAREILPLMETGPIRAKDAESILSGFGIKSADAINNAKRRLFIRSRRTGFKPAVWYWCLPGQEPTEDTEST